mgnify:CR=1 FL=1
MKPKESNQRMTRKKIGKAKTGKQSPFKPKISTAVWYIPADEITEEIMSRCKSNSEMRWLLVYPNEGKPSEIQDIEQLGDNIYELQAEGKQIHISAKTELHIYH